ncbi:MAG: transporter [Flavobacteriales bacterium]|nr:transporter [Flavobacteriales bacterium]
MKRILLTTFTLFAFGVMAQKTPIGENALSTDRPTQSVSPNTVDLGIIQIETGLLFERSQFSRNISVHRNAYPTSLFRIGLMKKLELRLVNEVVSYKTVNNLTNQEINRLSGTENMQVGLKYQISESDQKTIVGVLVHAILPTGSKGISNDRYGIFSRVNISHDISENKNISANFGYNNYDLDFTDEGLVKYADGEFTYTLIYGVGLSNRVGLFLESFGEYVEFKNWDNKMDAGITYLISNNIQLDYSYGWGLNTVMNFHAVGISVRLPK